MENLGVIVGKEEREKIISLFAQQCSISFSSIEKATGLRSNHLVYFLKQLQEEGMLIKEDDRYTLTVKGQSLIPQLSHVTGKESPPLAVVCAAIVSKGRICLIRRAKRPYQGYLSMIGGKLRHNETIPEAAVREAKEETGLDVIFDHYCGLLPEHVTEKGAVKHSFLLFLCKVTTVNDSLASSDEGAVGWYDLNKLENEKIVPSDLWMIKNMLQKKETLMHSTIDDAGNELGFSVRKH